MREGGDNEEMSERKSEANASGTKGNIESLKRNARNKMEKLSMVRIKLMPGVGGRDRRFHGRPAVNFLPIRVRCCHNHHHSRRR